MNDTPPGLTQLHTSNRLRACMHALSPRAHLHACARQLPAELRQVVEGVAWAKSRPHWLDTHRMKKELHKQEQPQECAAVARLGLCTPCLLALAISPAWPHGRSDGTKSCGCRSGIRCCCHTSSGRHQPRKVRTQRGLKCTSPPVFWPGSLAATPLLPPRPTPVSNLLPKASWHSSAGCVHCVRQNRPRPL